MLSDRIALRPVASDGVRLNAWLDGAFAGSSLEKPLAADLKLCLNEVFDNLVEYAFKETADPSIVIEIELGPGSAGASISDNGAYFDIRRWPLPAMPKDLQTAKPGGFGIALIHALASQIDYDRVDGVNRLRILCTGSANRF
jgi:anti-sigma regulatory factor (Ser/Thr protein kinase)